jgi:hypothetical protein
MTILPAKHIQDVRVYIVERQQSETALTPNDMACFVLLAAWPSKSGLTPTSKKLCDVSIEWREKAKSKIWKMGHEKF